MIKKETWHVALDALLADKVKAALTMLGVTIGATIGATCIILVVTVSMIGKNYVMAQIEAVGTDLVYAYFPKNHLSRSRADEISLADLAAARALPHVVEAAGVHDIGNANIVINAAEKSVTHGSPAPRVARQHFAYLTHVSTIRLTNVSFRSFGKSDVTTL